DGMPSICYLYFSNQDISMMRSLTKKNGTRETQQIHLQNLNDVTNYCTNYLECRRVQVLRYFGEVFDAKNCSINENA
ncbi:RecQ family zinc-binding domain-containing protein, partial [Salmonella enterica subsp. enterica serovar Soahanina]